MNVTEKLYYTDSYLRRFEAQVVGSEGNRIYLDRTAFYPASGGQPFDLGTIGGQAIVEVADEQGRVAHVLAGLAPSGTVQCEIDWPRRFDHMQQHTGQHLLSAVLVELFDIQTLSFHLGSEVSTIDVDASALDADRLSRVEERAGEVVFENRPVTLAFAANSANLELRKASGREGELRIVSIEGLDRSACGGTHVRSTAEIGPILIRKLDKIRGSVRIEFVCGMRAIRRARADYQVLSKLARAFSAPFDELPGLVATEQARVQEVERTLRKMSAENAAREGRELYAATAPGTDGLRRMVRNARLDDDLRTMAQAFTSGSKAMFLAMSENPPAVLLAASNDSGVHAGNLVKAAVMANGGRGGGSATIGQGSVPTREALDNVKSRLA